MKVGGSQALLIGASYEQKKKDHLTLFCGGRSHNSLVEFDI